MISCPKCNATLPDWAQTCQFCQTDVTKVARPKPVVQQKRNYMPVASWIWPCYYAMCAVFVLEGAGGILHTVASSHEKFMGQEIGLGVFSFISMAFDGFTALLGIGLAMRIELARGIVNFICGLRILFGVLDLAGALMGTLFLGPLGFILVILSIVNIVTAIFMIYLIGETDKNPPNI